MVSVLVADYPMLLMVSFFLSLFILTREGGSPDPLSNKEWHT